MRIQLLAATIAIVSGLWAGPVEKRDPVAEGFPDWEGLTEKNFVSGRALYTRRMTPSDLRHKVVIVVEADVSDLKKFQTEQLPLVARLAVYNSMLVYAESSMGTILSSEAGVPRSCVVLVSLHGKMPVATADELFTSPKDKALTQKIGRVATSYCPIYFNAGMIGAPENTEKKYPFAYVLNGLNDEPVWKGVVTEAATAEILKIVKKAKDELPEWKPLTGVAEATTQKTAFKLIQGGKFTAAQKALAGGIKSKDKETAAEAQKMYDAIVQYQSDMLYLIQTEVTISPALAYSDIQKFVKQFPAAKKNLVVELKRVASAQPLGDIVSKFRLWSSPDYTPKNAGEVKKNLAEIAKWKKTLSAFEKNPNMTIQGDAMYLTSQLDSLEATMKAKITK